MQAQQVAGNPSAQYVNPQSPLGQSLNQLPWAQQQSMQAQHEAGNPSAQGTAMQQTPQMPNGGSGAASFAPTNSNQWGGTATYGATGYGASTYNPSYQAYLQGPQAQQANAYNAAFYGQDPNQAFQTYNQSNAMLRGSAAPSNAMALQAEAAQDAAAGITNSSANAYNLGNLQQQQNAALLGQDASLLNTAQGQYGQYAMQNQNLQNANSQFNAGQNTQNSQFNAGQGNQMSSLGYQGLLGQESQNQNAANTAGQFNAGALNTAGQFNAGAANSANQYDASSQNAFTEQNMNAYNNWLNSMQNQNFQQQNMALGSYLGAFGDTSAGNVYQNAGGSEAGAYNNAFNQQNANNNAWEGVLGQALGAGGQVAAASAGKPPTPPGGSGFGW
jgi:hypothetical protein